MTDPYADIRDLGKEIVKGQRSGLGDGALNRAVVLSVEGNTCTVTVGGEFEQPGVRWLRDGYYPVIGDLVWLIRYGDSDNFILGRTNAETEWRTYTPTFGNGWTIGGAGSSLEAKYKMTGTTCDLRVLGTFGSGFSSGSGALVIMGPYAAADFLSIGTAHFVDVGTKRYHGGCRTVNPGFANISCTHEDAPLGVLAASPFTWAVGDQFHLQISYEIQTS